MKPLTPSSSSESREPTPPTSNNNSSLIDKIKKIFAGVLAFFSGSIVREQSYKDDNHANYMHAGESDYQTYTWQTAPGSTTKNPEIVSSGPARNYVIKRGTESQQVGKPCAIDARLKTVWERLFG